LKKPWIWFVVAVVLGGVTIGVVVWLRGQSPQPPSTLNLSEADAPVPVEHSAGTLEFDLVPQRQGVETVVQAIEEHVENESQTILGDPLLVERLGDAVAGRMAMMMEADVNAWASEAGRFAETPDLDAVDPFFKNTMRVRWMAAARGYENVPVASSGISVRSVEPQEEPNFQVGAPGLVIRAAAGLASANYPSPPIDEPLLRAVEVRIPIKIRTEGSSRHDQPAMAALRLFWNARMEEWQPYDLIVYVDSSVTGKTVPFPYL